jgi:hypothetical protein
MTVIWTSSPRRSLKLAPKMMFASGSAAARISSAASVTSQRERFEEPVMLKRIPWAPVMFTSSKGLAMAWRAASTARFSPLAPADPHEGRAGVLHDRPDVGEVEVDEPGDGDDVADPLNALAEDVVDDLERVEDARVLLDDVAKAVVRDRDEGVDLRLQLLGRPLGDELAAAPFEAEGLRDDADGEGTELLGDLGDDGGRPGAGPPAEPGGDEDHVRIAEGLGDLLRILFGRPLADGGVASGAQAPGDLVADPDLVGRVGLEEGLGIGVAGDELDAHHLGPDHPVDGVAPAATDADDADQREVLGIGSQRHRLSSGLAVSGLVRFVASASRGCSVLRAAARPGLLGSIASGRPVRVAPVIAETRRPIRRQGR